MQIMNEDNRLLLLRQSRATRFTSQAQDKMSELGFPPVFVEGRLETHGGNLTFYILDTSTFVKSTKQSRKENRLLRTNPEVFSVFQNITDLKESPIDMWIIPSYVSSHYESECFRFDVMINPINTDECFRMSISEADLKGIIRFVKKEKPTIDKITTLYQPPSQSLSPGGISDTTSH